MREVVVERVQQRSRSILCSRLPESSTCLHELLFRSAGSPIYARGGRQFCDGCSSMFVFPESCGNCPVYCALAAETPEVVAAWVFWEKRPWQSSDVPGLSRT